MSKFKIPSTVLAAAVASVASVSVASADEPIKIGIDAAYKPYAYVEASGELAGFEIDLIKAVCAEIKAQCELSNVPWDGIFTALETGTIDMIGTTVTKSPARLEKYDASRTIYRVGYGFLVPEGSDTAAVLDLDAGRIAAFMSDNLQLEQQYVASGDYKLAAEATFDPQYTGEGRAWIFRKGSDELVGRIDAGLVAVTEAGIVDELGLKYFNTELETE